MPSTLRVQDEAARARRERRGTQELLTLYVVERWLARLSASPHADKFVIKGGMLLAAYDARRPTADLDALARSIADDRDVIVSLVLEIAHLPLADGVEFRTDTATSRIIREQAIYSGVRIAMDSTIARTRLGGTPGAAAKHGSSTRARLSRRDGACRKNR